MKVREELASFREIGIEELETKVSEFRRELMNLRFSKNSNQLENPGQLRVVRQRIARALTVINEKSRVEAQ